MPEQCGVRHLIVNGDAIRPADADVDQNNPLGAVQSRALDAGILTPLCPEQISAHINTEEHVMRFKNIQKGNS